MPNVSHSVVEQETLLASGTNELEVLVFTVGDHAFGINAAKVRDVLPVGSNTIGVVPVVSLRRHLQVGDGDSHSDQVLIVAEVNRQHSAFAVDRVEGTHRLSWEQVLAVPATSSLAHSPVTSFARIGARLVTMLDFEMIVGQVSSQIPDDTHKKRMPAKEDSLKAWIQPGKATPVVAEQAPVWEVEGDESPAELNPRLWQTYRTELADRSRHLGRLVQQWQETGAHPALVQELLRTLHTIEAASLIVPVNEVVRLTRLIDEQLQRHGAGGTTALADYVAWLQNLAAPGSNVAQALRRGRAFYEQLLAAAR
jgi:chemotaxis signal transduction protein